ncbi:MAG: hypothetical protein VKS61_11725 [Candidatus Sericytochromatia bacterium]|nr:hypothetical protein [Candidatus Sericytochromatia bacterium]
MRMLLGRSVAALLAATMVGCGAGQGPAAQGEAGGAPPAGRTLLSVDRMPPAEAANPEAAMANLPASISVEEAAGRLVTIDEAAIVAPDASSGESRSISPYRLGYYGRHRFWNWGYAPYWGSAWRAYNYLPAGNYMFPYYLSDGRYWRYTSSLSPYFYRYGGAYWPYYAGYRWF